MLTYNIKDYEPVLCREFPNDTEARIAQAALENAGIESILDNDIFSRIYPIGFNSLGAIRLMVKGRDLQRALDIISSLNFEGE